MAETTDYGRYDDDPDYVSCPRARSDMTPCVARDGRTAVADDGVCVGCARRPGELLVELSGKTTGGLVTVHAASEEQAAEALKVLVWQATGGCER